MPIPLPGYSSAPENAAMADRVRRMEAPRAAAPRATFASAAETRRALPADLLWSPHRWDHR